MLIHQDARVYAGLFDGDEQRDARRSRRVAAPTCTSRAAPSRANGVALDAGDALKLTDTTPLALDGGRDAEVLVFDLPGSR